MNGRYAENTLFAQMNVYPNPTKNEINIAFTSNLTSSESAIVMLKDMTGRIIYSNTIALSNGAMQMTIDLSTEVTSGIYFVSIETKLTHLNERVVVIK